MTKADLVEQVADAIGPGITKKDCALVVDGFLNAVKQALAEGHNIEIRGFGTFKVRRRKTRTARTRGTWRWCLPSPFGRCQPEATFATGRCRWSTAMSSLLPWLPWPRIWPHVPLPLRVYLNLTP